MRLIMQISVRLCTQKREAYCIAPLQPPTLASIKTWGSSEGAGRAGLPYFANSHLTISDCKGTTII